jgi:hypothetical protein
VKEEGAQIYVDDELVGTSPLMAPVTLDIGERRLRVVKAGFQVFEKTLAVGGSADITVEIPLQKEVHEGKLIIEAPAGAQVVIDDRPAGTGRAEQVVQAGGHQLRVTAPGMRPYQTEIVVQDKETRAVNVVLERVTEAEKPMLRVAVGCGDPAIASAVSSLVAGLPAATPEMAPCSAVRRSSRWPAQARAATATGRLSRFAT